MPLVAVHHGAGEAECLFAAHAGLLRQNVRNQTVGIGLHDSRNDEEHCPQNRVEIPQEHGLYHIEVAVAKAVEDFTDLRPAGLPVIADEEPLASD